jgi:TrmH family RNA methyltransferase
VKASLPPATEPVEDHVVLTKAELQRLRSLRDKKHREALGLFVVEGAKVVGELLAAGFPFIELYATDVWPDRVVGGVPSMSAEVSAKVEPRMSDRGEGEPRPPLTVTRITPEEMARASHFPTPSEVLAVGRITRPPLAPGTLARGLTLALDGVQDAGNVGTLLRIADWFAFDRVVLSPDCADLFHQKVINASMGSFARVTTHTADLAKVFTELAATAPATPILGCDLGGTDVHTLPSLRDAIVVIGSEGRGLSAAVRKSVTYYVTVPRHGAAESLNAAVAAGIICDQLRRAR